MVLGFGLWGLRFGASQSGIEQDFRFGFAGYGLGLGSGVGHLATRTSKPELGPCLSCCVDKPTKTALILRTGFRGVIIPY